MSNCCLMIQPNVLSCPRPYAWRRMRRMAAPASMWAASPPSLCSTTPTTITWLKERNLLLEALRSVRGFFFFFCTLRISSFLFLLPTHSPKLCLLSCFHLSFHLKFLFYYFLLLLLLILFLLSISLKLLTERLD